MSKAIKIRIIVATFFVVVGLIMFTAVMSEYQWDFAKLSTEKYETNSYEISEEFSNLSMNTDTADIIFALSDDGKCKVECYEVEKGKHSVAVQGDTLVIDMLDERSWYDHIGINFGSPKITVYLPKTEYTSLSINEDTGDIEVPKDFKFTEIDILLSTGDVAICASASELIRIKTSTGDIRVENISTGSLELSVSTGKVTALGVTCEGDLTVSTSTGKAYLTDIQCKNFTSSGNTGDISLNNVIATDKFSIARSTGNVNFDGCDATEILVETDTGKVSGSLLTDKVFITETSTGSIDVPKTTTGGRCEISTSTGNIKITVKQS